MSRGPVRCGPFCCVPGSVIVGALTVVPLVCPSTSLGQQARKAPDGAVTLKGPPGAVAMLTYSRSGRLLVSTNRTSVVAVWSVRDRAVTHEIRWPAAVRSLDFSGDETRLFIGYGDGTLLSYDLGSRRTAVREFDGPVAAVSPSPDGKTLAVGAGREVALLRLDTGRVLASVRGHTKPISAVAWSADSAIVASGGWDSAVRLWDVRTMRPVHAFSGLEEQEVPARIFIRGQSLVVGCHFNRAVLWDLGSKRVTAELMDEELAGSPLSFAYHPPRDSLAVAAADSIRCINIKKRTSSTFRAAHNVGSIAFSPDGKSLAIGYGNPAGTSDEPANAGVIHVMPFDADVPGIPPKHE
jgi:WD40 repeat protein